MTVARERLYSGGYVLLLGNSKWGMTAPAAALGGVPSQRRYTMGKGM